MAPARSPSSSRSSNALENSGALRKGGASNLSKSWNGSEIPQRNAASKYASPIPSQHAVFEQKENEREPNALENSRALRKGGAFNLSNSRNSSEISQRNAVSKSSSPITSPPAFFEQKENEREPNCSMQAKARPSKGMKSFMAPTISAASKFTAASARKKILVERNQVVRESTECNIVSAEEMKREEETMRKSEIFIGSEEKSGQNISRMLDFSSSKDQHQLVVTHSHDSGALDDDSSLPPYDPIKNYLSPRPQFLHYKPNPKFVQQQDLLYAGDARWLEDSFSGSDDSGNTAYCSGTVDENDETLMMTQKTQFFLETNIPKPKPRSIGRSKLLPFVLILAVMSFCIPFIESPLLAPIKMKDQSFVGPHTLPFRVLQDVDFHGYLDVASRNLQGFATRIRHWSMSYFEIFSSFGSFPIELDISHSLNATISSLSMVQSTSLDICYTFDSELAGKKNIITEQDDVDSMKIEFPLDKKDVEALAGNGIDIAKGVFELSDEEALADDKDVVEKIKVEFSYEEDNFSKYEKRLILFTDPLAKFEIFNKIEQPEKTEIAKSEEVYEGVYPLGFNVARKLEDQALITLGKEGIDSPAYPLVELRMAHKDLEDFIRNFLTDLQPYISSRKNLVLEVLGMFVAASMVFLFIKLKQTVPSTRNKYRHKKTKLAPHAINICKHVVNGDLSSHEATEMSSIFKNNLHRSEMRRHPTTPSHKITQKRESVVSSSVSYGSFTSFERRSQSKRKGHSKEEEEVMTPVRRSSRIRNQVSSP